MVRKNGSKRSRKSKKRSRSSFTKRVAKISKQVSLRLCEPKACRAITMFETLGNNSPLYLTGGLNLGLLLNEAKMLYYNSPAANQVPDWLPLVGSAVADLTDPTDPNTIAGGGQSIVGRFQPQTGILGAQAAKFATSYAGMSADTRNGDEVIATKLRYKVNFFAQSGYSRIGCNCSYRVILFRYKSTQLLPEYGLATATLHTNSHSAHKLLNAEPRSATGINPYVRAKHTWKGTGGDGGMIPDMPEPVASGDISTRQYAWNGRWDSEYCKVVKEVKFQFQPSQGYSSSNYKDDPPLHKTIVLDVDFKGGRKIRYGLRVQEEDSDADPATRVGDVMEQGIAPVGFNYGLCIVASANPGYVAPAPGLTLPQLGYLPNYTERIDPNPVSPGDIPTLVAEERVAAVTIEKSFYFRDP